MQNTVNLLYVDEHLGCANYIKENNIGFTHKVLAKDENYVIRLESEFAILFLTKGKLEVKNPAEKPVIVSRGEVCLLTNYYNYQINVRADANLTIMFFDRPNSRCDLLALDKMNDRIKKSDKAKIRKMEMVNPLKDFVKGMEFYLSQKMLCRHLHDIKESEFFFLIRGFYPKEQVARFFTPVIISLNDFSNQVRANYMKVDSVAELATLLNMTSKTFTRRFKAEFGTTPKQWLLQEKSKFKKLTKKQRVIIGLAN